MIKRHKTVKTWYLMYMVIFIGFSFEFFIRGDNFLGGVLIFNGIISLLAFQQIPRKIAPVTVLLNIFNTLISLTVFYNYLGIDYTILLLIWTALSIGYFVAVIRQITNLLASSRSKRKLKKRND
ncbi:MAG: hypothetical protein JKY48_14730 [Flavobacteriales bacterium]|nr:hypothetical protein [Flavobacteriales bacterium]